MIDNYTISFVILNYETYWETFNCVESITETFNSDEYKIKKYIVIVDNGSSNDSEKILNSKYKYCENIYIIETGKNLGFARGNNIGFGFAKDKLKSDFILMVNSDVLFTDKDFATKLIQDYKHTYFDVAGPDVVLSNGNRINPFLSPDLSIDSIEREIHDLRRKIVYTKLHVEPIVALLTRIPKYFSDKKIAEDLPDKTFELDEKYSLHGCFLIFSKGYIDEFNGLYDKTFLYGEEILLKLRCERSGLKMWFLSDLKAVHNESQTEKFIGGGVNIRHRRRYNNILNSMYIIKDYIENKSDR